MLEEKDKMEKERPTGFAGGPFCCLFPFVS
jgi:hypothetical protein